MIREEAIKTIMSATVWTDEEREALGILIPELRESEDERIRKALIEVFKKKLERGFEWVEYGIPNRSVLSWLEKQKEPHFTKRNALFDKCVENCDPEIMKKVSDKVDEMLEKEQKPNFDTHWENGSIICEQKDQKPRKFKLGDKVHCCWDDYNTNAVTITGFRDDAYLTDSAHGYIPFCNENSWERIEQNPTEINLNALLTADRLASAEMTGRLKERSEILENPEKYGLQKPAEWSEEDEIKIISIIAFLKSPSLCAMDENKGIIDANIKYLKSIKDKVQSKSHWKPSEKEITAFENMLKGEFPHGIFPGVTLSELLTKLKKLYYNEQIPYWKPSKEHMKALFHAVNKARTLYFTSIDGCPEYNDLRSLYEQLKNLM